jgi:hypothetical protein
MLNATNFNLGGSFQRKLGIACFLSLIFSVGCGGSGENSGNSTTQASNPTPAITSLSPSSAMAGAAAQTLAINGSNFLTTSAVTYNSVAHTAAFVSSSQLTIPLSASDQASGGNYPVVVSNPSPGGGASNSINFAVDNPAPVISSLSPPVAPAGTSSQTVSINGSGFVSGSSVTYNGVVHTPTNVTASQLTIQLTATDLATASTYPVVVTNPTPGGGASDSAAFTVFTPVTSEQGTTNAQGQVSFTDAGITIQAQDLVTAQLLPGMDVTLLQQQGATPAVAVADPTGTYIPLISALSSSASASPLIRRVSSLSAAGDSGGSDPSYVLSLFVAEEGAYQWLWNLQQGIDESIQDASEYSGGCSTVQGGTSTQPLSDLTSTVNGMLSAANSQRNTVIGALQDVVSTGIGTLLDVPEVAGGIIVEDDFSTPSPTSATAQLQAAETQMDNDLNSAYSGLPYSTAYEVCTTYALFGSSITNFTVSVATPPSTLPSGTGSIQGVVEDSLGNPISGALVVATGPVQQGIATNANGDFTISSLPAGTYSVQASASGSAPSTTSVTIADAAVNLLLTLPNAPVATSVQFSSGPPYTITLSGAGFGTPQTSVPYTGDLGNFSIADESCYATTPSSCEEGYTGDADALQYQSWSNSKIVVGGYSQYGGSNVATPGDAIEIGVWNDADQIAQAGYVWAGNLPPIAAGTPHISAVLFSGSGANLNIAILGSGFGNTPPSGVPSSSSGTPYVGLTSNLRIGDYAGRISQETQSVTFRAGFQNPVDGAQDPVTIQYLDWSDSEIDLGGFGGQYGTGAYTIEGGDPISVIVWSTSSNLATGWGGYVPAQQLQTTFQDAFAKDTTLNTALWGTDTSLLQAVAKADGETLVEPQISFSSSGMTMSGASGTYQFTGVQSQQSFTPPFSLQITAMGTVANGNPFWLDLTSGNTSNYITIAGDLNPNNGGYYGVNLNASDPNFTAGVKLYTTPSVNTWYTVAITVDATGLATVVLTNTATGAVLGSQSGINIGTGPFYLILGQYEGLPRTVGPNTAVWGDAVVFQ